MRPRRRRRQLDSTGSTTAPRIDLLDRRSGTASPIHATSRGEPTALVPGAVVSCLRSDSSGVTHGFDPSLAPGLRYLQRSRRRYERRSERGTGPIAAHRGGRTVRKAARTRPPPRAVAAPPPRLAFVPRTLDTSGRMIRSGWEETDGHTGRGGGGPVGRRGRSRCRRPRPPEAGCPGDG